MPKKRSYNDWCIILFSKRTFNPKLENHPLCTFKRTLEDAVVMLTFRGPEKEISKLIVNFELEYETKLEDERSLLMIIDREGIVGEWGKRCWR